MFECLLERPRERLETVLSPGFHRCVWIQVNARRLETEPFSSSSRVSESAPDLEQAPQPSPRDVDHALEQPPSLLCPIRRFARVPQ
jgi:hypothetical protein